MKVFIVTMLAAAAVAEPQVFLGYQHHGVYPQVLPGVQHVLPQQYIKPVQVKYEQKPMEHEAKPMKVETYAKEDPAKKVVQYKHEVPLTYQMLYQPVSYYQPTVKAVVPAKYHVKNGALEHTVYKREADPVYPYYHNFPYMTHHAVPSVYGQVPMTYGAVPAVVPQVAVHPKVEVEYENPNVEGKDKTVANDVFSPYFYAAKGRYFAKTEGTEHRAKRDAYWAPTTYGLPLATPYYNHGVYNYGYAAHTSPSAAVVPTHMGYKLKSYANDAVKLENYAGKGTIYRENAGAIHIAKREAEADSQYLVASPYLNKPYTGFYNYSPYSAYSPYFG